MTGFEPQTFALPDRVVNRVRHVINTECYARNRSPFFSKQNTMAQATRKAGHGGQQYLK
jgi:hypothetical protein